MTGETYAGVISAELEAQPPNAAPSATIPRIRMFDYLPRPGAIQAQLAVEGKGRRAFRRRKDVSKHGQVVSEENTQGSVRRPAVDRPRVPESQERVSL